MRDAPVESLNVSAIIVTRGKVDLTAILATIPRAWEIVVWDNGAAKVWVVPPEVDLTKDESWLDERAASDLAVYGRYAAIEHASGDLIYVQDDDCVVSDPQAIVDALWGSTETVACNMPAVFREQDFYFDHALVGFGAVFHRDLPAVKAFDRWYGTKIDESKNGEWGLFRNTCDIVFTALTPRVLVDVPYENLPWADGPDRMYRQDSHVAERTRMLELVRKVRDG